MSKPLKIILGIFGGLLFLLVAAAIALPLLFDPNHFRAQIAVAVNDEYHRSLELGDIKLSVFPWLRVRVSNARLGNAEGFGKQPFAEVGELDIGVALMPLLFNHRVDTEAISLSGLKLNLQKNAKGETNWADLTAAGKDKKETPESKQSSDFTLKSVNISSVEISDASVDYLDQRAGKHYSLDKLNLKTGALKPGKPFDIDLSVALTSQAPAAHIALKLGGTVLADTDAKVYTVSGLKLNADLSGAAVPGGKQTVKLDGDASYNQADGSARLSKAELQAAGLTLATEISASGLGGDAPKLSGPIKIKPFKPRDVMAALGMKPMETADKSVLGEAGANAQYSGDFNSAALNGLTLNLDQTTIRGNLGIKDFATQAIVFALKADKLDVDRYLAPKSANAAKGDAADPAVKRAELNATKLPGDAINALNVNGTFDIATLKASGINMSGAHLALSGAKGSPKQQEFSANLYGGQIRATTRVSGRNYAVDTQLTSLNAGPFLKDFLGKDKVSGVGNLKLGLGGSGATVGELRRSLNGDISFNLQNGAVKGFNLGQIIRGAQATFAGQQLSAQDNSAQQTDFATFSASGKIVNGVLRSDTLDAKSPLFRLAGAGEIDLVNETLDYTAKPTIVESSQGQGGKELDALRGVTIPIHLTGSIYAPKYKLALGDILKQQATTQLQKQLGAHQDEIQQKLNDKLGKDLGGILGNLLGGKKQQPAQPPQPAQPAQPQAAPQQPGT